MIGRLYKIVSKQTDKVYYGSTERTLEQRFQSHKSEFKILKTSACEILCYDDCEIILLDIVEVANIKELKTYERKYIETNECVNKNIPGRTKHEYYLKNRNKCLEKSKEYQQTDKSKEYRKQKYLENSETLLEKNKEYRLQNRDKIKEKKTEKMTCICSKTFTRQCKAAHERSQFHCQFIKT